jgi:uncharacterized protein
MRPALRNNDYGHALLIAAHTMGDKIAAAKQVSIPEQRARRPRPGTSFTDIPWPVFLGGMVLLFWLMSAGRGGGGGRYRGGGGGGFLSGLILGNVLSSGRGWGHTSGGGGFGGYDSGDSFGGFGGGDSGGGGASSDW